MAIEEIYILHHTHVDIGYTDLPWLVYEQHVKIIEQALDLCRQTDDFPEPARFRWINEFSWPVLHFLSECPDRVEEVIGSDTSRGDDKQPGRLRHSSLGLLWRSRPLSIVRGNFYNNLLV